MSRETERKLEREIEDMEAGLKAKRAALETIKESLPAVFMAAVMPSPFTPGDDRLCVKVTDAIKASVDQGAEYLTIMRGGGTGNPVATARYIRERYEIKEAIFD